ncbi:MAG: nickel-responsive transcriptional regulator NikR [Deltaproteobacteria bacterium]|nr:nickel-responsive transcriptional regulator NikR [Deltaproteobacteria bacterium]
MSNEKKHKATTKTKRITRFGVSLSDSLLQQFDKSIAARGYTNRSEAIRDLIRRHLVEREWKERKGKAVGTLTIIYDHRTRELSDKLTDEQHEHYTEVISTLHVHLDHDTCLEVLVVKGRNSKIRKLADTLLGMKGVLHGKLTMTTTGKGLA